MHQHPRRMTVYLLNHSRKHYVNKCVADTNPLNKKLDICHNNQYKEKLSFIGFYANT